MTSAGWARRQIELLRAHESRTTGAARRRVKLCWWRDVSRPQRRADLLAPVARLWSGRALDPGPTVVALYEATDPVGTPPFLVFRAEPDRLPGASGRAVVTVVGEAVPGGTLVVESRHGTIVPLEPPAEPGEDAPVWSEIDAEA
jgi:hypothetical protein